jgi:hypothetical protein
METGGNKGGMKTAEIKTQKDRNGNRQKWKRTTRWKQAGIRPK